MQLNPISSILVRLKMQLFTLSTLLTLAVSAAAVPHARENGDVNPLPSIFFTRPEANKQTVQVSRSLLPRPLRWHRLPKQDLCLRRPTTRTSPRTEEIPPEQSTAHLRPTRCPLPGRVPHKMGRLNKLQRLIRVPAIQRLCRKHSWQSNHWQRNSSSRTKG